MVKVKGLGDYLPIEKVAENISEIALQNKIQGIINCCSGSPISIRKFIEDFILANSYNISLNLGFYPYPNYEPMAFWGEIYKLKKVLNYV